MKIDAFHYIQLGTVYRCLRTLLLPMQEQQLGKLHSDPVLF